MTSQYRHRRTSNPATPAPALEPGEIHVNTANRQLTVGDTATGTVGAPLPLLALRIFDARAIYAVNDYVIQSGIMYRAKVVAGPGAFNAVQWDLVAGQQVGAFVLRSGDLMTGHLTLPTGPGADQAIRRDYVEAALVQYASKPYVDAIIAPLATQSYVNTQDAKAVLKTGSVMTGPLTLPTGDPTNDLHATSKAYVDSKVTTAPGVPTGAVMDFAMMVPPTGWLACDGQAVSRTDYAALFAAIGTLWGAGDGATTFNVPEFRNRFRRHRQFGGGLAGDVGTMQSPCNLSHYHGVNLNSGYVSSDHQHYTSGTTGAADRSLDHTHGYSRATSAGGFPKEAGAGTSPFYMYDSPNTGGMDRSIDHLHAFGAWSGGANANHFHTTTGNTGGGSADDNNEARPYSVTVLTCIKV